MRRSKFLLLSCQSCENIKIYPLEFAKSLFFFLATFWTLKLCTEQRLSAGIAHHTHGSESFRHIPIEGWKLSWRNREVCAGLLVVTFAALLLIPFSTLLPIFARHILAIGAKGQGLLLTSMGRRYLAQFRARRHLRGVILGLRCRSRQWR